MKLPGMVSRGHLGSGSFAHRPRGGEGGDFADDSPAVAHAAWLGASEFSHFKFSKRKPECFQDLPFIFHGISSSRRRCRHLAQVCVLSQGIYSWT